ncbi:MAG: class I SAM-dependent methyltransferase, partial [Planctomycetota bacterium]
PAYFVHLPPMNWLREALKTALTFAPTDLLEIVTNYSVLRADGGRLLPPRSVTGSKTVLYKHAHRLAVAPGIPAPENPAPGIPGTSGTPSSSEDFTVPDTTAVSNNHTPPPMSGKQTPVSPAAGASGRPDPPILFLEFGVFEGNSIRRWAKLNPHPDSRFVGFDSFEGLPTKWRQRPAGHFSTDGLPPEIADPRVSFVKGWFHDTVPGFLDALAHRRGLEGDEKNLPGVVIHIDADLYTSAIFLLTQLHPYFDRYHVLFDDYAAGEARALYAYLVAYGADFQPLLGRKRHPRAFVPNQAFGHLTTNRPHPRPRK